MLTVYQMKQKAKLARRRLRIAKRSIRVNRRKTVQRKCNKHRQNSWHRLCNLAGWHQQ